MVSHEKWLIQNGKVESHFSNKYILWRGELRDYLGNAVCRVSSSNTLTFSAEAHHEGWEAITIEDLL